MSRSPSVRGECRSCHAAIFWLMSTGSRRIAPIDTTPVGPIEGSIEVDLERGTYEVNPVLKNRQDLASVGAKFFRNHFQTCPDQQRWRERRAMTAEKNIP